MTDLQIIRLIEDQIEYNKHMIKSARMWGINNKVVIAYSNKNDVLYHILDKIKEQICEELEQQYNEVNKHD